MAIIGKDYVTYLKTVKCRFPPLLLPILIAVPWKRQAGVNSPQMRVDDCVIYTSEGCIVELRLEKIYSTTHTCVKCQSLQSESSLWKYFFERPY